MKIAQELIEQFLVDGLIAHAERTLAESKKAGYRGRASADLEALLGKLYEERRAIMEEMMRKPLSRAGRYDT